MGSRCSSMKMTSVILPTKRDSHITPAPKANKITSLNGSRRVSKNDDVPTENVTTPPGNSTGVAIRHRSSPHDAATEEGIRQGSASHLNETNGNISRTTEISNVKRLFQYKKGPLIGKGTYGEVYECLNLNTGELLAVKSFKIYGDYNKVSGYIETMKKEVTLLRGLGHPNIVKYFTTEITEVRDSNFAIGDLSIWYNKLNQGIVDIVLEYVSGGSVRKLLDKFNKLEEKVIGTYIRQVLEGLTYLHLNGIVHRNIKGSNILIDTTGIIKLTDFGVSGRPDRFSEDSTQDTTRTSSASKGPAYWSAPEVYSSREGV